MKVIKAHILSGTILVVFGTIVLACNFSSSYAEEKAAEREKERMRIKMEEQLASLKQQAAEPSEPVEPEIPPVPDPNFVTVRENVCSRYKRAPNDIKKSAVFNEYFEASKKNKHTITDIIGIVKKIETTHGGGQVTFTVTVPFGELTNNDALQNGLFGEKRYQIKKGTPLYNKIGDLSEGQKVKVSGSDIMPRKNPFSEEVSVCGDGGWITKYTAIEQVQDKPSRREEADDNPLGGLEL